MTTEFLPERTIRYKTFVKNTLVDAINGVLSQHPDELLQRTQASGEWSREEVDFPRIIVRFFEREIQNAGVGHEETVYLTGESDSIPVAIDLPTGGAVQLTWDPIPNAVAYKVYRLIEGQQTVSFTMTARAFVDAGQTGTEENVPDVVSANLELPMPTAVALPPGTLITGSGLTPSTVLPPTGTLLPSDGSPITYRITALTRTEAVKFGHYFYSADIEFAVYALSSLDRDYIADTLVQTVALGRLTDYTNSFFERIYPTQELYPDSYWNYIALNSDLIQGFGETTSQVPWGSEDDLLYQTSYRVGAFGEFYSLPPKLTSALVQKITQYPYVSGVEPEPEGAPGDDAEWVSNSVDG